MTLAAVSALAGPGMAVAQGINQLACRVVIERSGDDVSAFPIAQAAKRTKASYRFRATKISASGTGASEQKGEKDLPEREVTVLSKVQFRLEPDGWVDFELDVTERLTGTTCHAKETVNQF